MRPIVLALGFLIAALVAMSSGSTPGNALTSTPTPSPFPFPNKTETIVNETSFTADQLILHSYPTAGLQLLFNPIGCGQPEIVASGFPIDPFVFTWPEPCVDPGEELRVFIFTDCSDCPIPSVYAHEWKVVTTDPTPTPNPVTIAVIQNETNKIARGLILHSHGIDGFMIAENPPGCPNPSADGDVTNLDPIYFTWPIPCINPGESVSIRLSNVCSPCAPPEVYAHEWTFTTPTPSGQTRSPTPSPTATPTSSATETSHSSATPFITPASLPHTGATGHNSSMMLVSLFAGLTLAATGFFLARRGAIR